MALKVNKEHKVIGGVCAGLGDALGIDPAIIRLAFLFSLLFGGAGGILYIILWIIMQ